MAAGNPMLGTQRYDTFEENEGTLFEANSKKNAFSRLQSHAHTAKSKILEIMNIPRSQVQKCKQLFVVQANVVFCTSSHVKHNVCFSTFVQFLRFHTRIFVKCAFVCKKWFLATLYKVLDCQTLKTFVSDTLASENVVILMFFIYLFHIFDIF